MMAAAAVAAALAAGSTSRRALPNLDGEEAEPWPLLARRA
jgi:hypothetical protein